MDKRLKTWSANRNKFGRIWG